jgi:hypothetical protein
MHRSELVTKPISRRNKKKYTTGEMFRVMQDDVSRNGVGGTTPVMKAKRLSHSTFTQANISAKKTLGHEDDNLSIIEQNKTPPKKKGEKQKVKKSQLKDTEESDVKMAKFDAEFEAFKKKIQEPMLKSFTQFVQAGESSMNKSKQNFFNKRNSKNLKTHNSGSKTFQTLSKLNSFR